MPTVPLPVRRTQAAPVPTPGAMRRDVSSGTAAVARGLAEVGQAASMEAQREAREREQARADARRARLQQAWNDLGATRLEIESTARQQKGRFALETDLVEQTSSSLATAADRIAEDLPEDMHAEFASIRRQHDLGLREAVTTHVGREGEAYKVEQYQGAIKTAGTIGRQAALATPAGGALMPGVGEARQSIVNAVDGQFRDAPPEARDAERMARLTAFHKEIVETLAQPQGEQPARPADAARYLQAAIAAKEIDPSVAGELSKALAGPAQVASALAAVQEIEAKIPDPQARLEAVLAIQGPLGEKALTVYKEREAAREETQKDADRARFGRVTETIEKGLVKTRSQLEAQVEFQRLSDEDRPRALKYLEDSIRGERALRAQERAAQSTVDEAALREYEALASNDPKAAAELDVTHRYAGQVSPMGLDRIRTRQGGARKQWDKDRGVGQQEFKGFVLSQVGRSITDKADRERFVATIDRRRQAWMGEDANAGKEPDRALLLKWIGEELQIGDASPGGSWLSPDRPRYKWPQGAAFFPKSPEEQKLLRDAGLPVDGSAPAGAAPPPPAATPARPRAAGDVPAGERALIVDAYRRAHQGKDPSDAEILQRYLRAHPEAR